jgi:hypothetical protein
MGDAILADLPVTLDRDGVEVPDYEAYWKCALDGVAGLVDAARAATDPGQQRHHCRDLEEAVRCLRTLTGRPRA